LLLKKGFPRIVVDEGIAPFLKDQRVR